MIKFLEEHGSVSLTFAEIVAALIGVVASIVSIVYILYKIYRTLKKGKIETVTESTNETLKNSLFQTDKIQVSNLDGSRR